MLDDLICEAVEMITACHKRWPNSVVLWSGGKDSTVMLHLMRFKAAIELPVIQFREPKFRERYAYSDQLIKDWELEIHEYPPFKVELTQGRDQVTGDPRFDILKSFSWGGGRLIMSLGTERPTEQQLLNNRYLCGLTDVLQRPTGTFNWPWTGMYVGTKSSDLDLLKGQIPLSMDVRHVDGCPLSIYPLRSWSDKDVFDYMEREGIPPDPTRYEKDFHDWGNKADKSLNADYYPVCFNCIDRSQGPHVDCPKLLNSKVSNISHLAPYADIAIPDLGVRPNL